jgi:hypothetical protein
VPPVISGLEMVVGDAAMTKRITRPDLRCAGLI